MAVVEDRFRAMASAVYVLVVDPPRNACRLIRERLHDLESRWSRFLPDSDVSRMNASVGEEPVDVSDDTLVLLEHMRRAHAETAGRYDPTLLREIISAGYDVSVDDPRRRSVTIDIPSGGASIGDIEIRRGEPRSGVVLPRGLAFDPGGIGKGLAADLVVGEQADAGATGVLVNLGGDLAVGGRSPTGDDWVIAVEDPLGDEAPVAVLGVNGGAVATSSTVSRRFRRAGRENHHIIDPQTGISADTDLLSVTVVAPAAWRAEAHAKAALLEGSDGAIDYLTSKGLSGVAVTDQPKTLHTPDIDPSSTLNARCP